MQKQAFETHPLWDSVAQLQSVVDKADERTEPGASEALSAIRFLVSLVKSHAEPSDPAPYSRVSLDAIDSILPNVINEVSNYSNNGNLAHLSTAETHADKAVHHVSALPTSLLKGGAASQAHKVFKEYRDDATATIEFLRGQTSDLRAELESAQRDFGASVAALKAEIAELSTKIKQDEARLDQALTTNNDAFTAKQTDREERFKDFLESQGKALKEMAASDLEEIYSRAEEAQAVYDQIDALREGTEKVAGLASADILAGKFASYSTQQWWWGVAANALGFVTLAIGVTVIALTVGQLGAAEQISWQYTTLKLGLTISIVAASAVAFRLGAVFLSRSGTSKRMELELRAIGPFFADIEDPEALKEAKRAFVERSFGRGWGEKSQDQGSSAGDSSAIIKDLVEIVRTMSTRTGTG